MKLGIKKISSYKDNYDMIPNFIFIRQSEDYYFAFNKFSYPYNVKEYNTGVWKIKYKLNKNK